MSFFSFFLSFFLSLTGPDDDDNDDDDDDDVQQKTCVRLSSSFTSSSRFDGNVFFPILDDLKSRWWVASLSFSISQSGREREKMSRVSDLQKVVIGSLTALSKEEDQSTPNARSFTHRGLETEEEEERKKNNVRALWVEQPRRRIGRAVIDDDDDRSFVRGDTKENALRRRF